MSKITLVIIFSIFSIFSVTSLFQLNNLLLKKTIQQEKITLKGKILSESGQAIFGIMILEKGTRNATTTDFNGNFTLKINKGAKIIISHVGYSNKEFKVNNSTIKIIASEDGFSKVNSWEWCCTSHGSEKHCDEDIEKLEENHEDDEVYERA